MECWDGNFYVDETIHYLRIPEDKYNRKISLIGAGVGVKNESVELLDWCGIAFYRAKTNQANRNKNGNGYWNFLGNQCLQLILMLQKNKFRPNKIYVCNQIAFYIMRAVLSTKPNKEIKSLVKKMRPVIHRAYKHENGIYQAKQKVGKLVKKKLRIKLSPKEIAEILKGRLYDIKTKELISIKIS